MTVPFFDLRAQHAAIRGELDEAVKRVLDTGRFALGPEVEAFEEELARKLGVKHVVGVSSGTDALLIGLMAFGIGPGDEVVTTPFTFFATAGVVHRVGAKIVFADIEPEGFNVDPAALEAALTPRTRVAIPVHLYGQCADMDPILEACSKRGVVVMEDAAQAIGARYGERPAGGMGRLGALSFYPTKNLGGLGDGGAVLTNDADLAGRVRDLRIHGAPKTYIHETVGMLARMDGLQGATLRVKLRHLDKWTEARRRNAERYAALFAEAKLDGPVADGRVKLPKELPGRRHVYHQYIVRVPDRDRLREHMTAAGVGAGVFYPLPLHLQPCFEYLGLKKGAFPEAERACEEVLALPIFPELTEEQQAEVVRTVKSFYDGSSGPPGVVR